MPFYKDKSKKNKKTFPAVAGQEGPVRVKMPRGREVIGIITQSGRDESEPHDLVGKW